MIVAEIHLTEGGFGDRGHVHIVAFSTLEKAYSEYDRVASIMLRREERTNDLPKMIEIDGDGGNKTTLPLDHIRSIGLVDYAKVNAQQAGVRDAFPNVFKR